MTLYGFLYCPHNFMLTMKSFYLSRLYFQAAHILHSLEDAPSIVPTCPFPVIQCNLPPSHCLSPNPLIIPHGIHHSSLPSWEMTYSYISHHLISHIFHFSVKLHCSFNFPGLCGLTWLVAFFLRPSPSYFPCPTVLEGVDHTLMWWRWVLIIFQSFKHTRIPREEN